MTTLDTASTDTPLLTRRSATAVDRSKLVLALPVTAALVVRLFALLHPGSLFGLTEYDDGVYMGEILRLTHGALPYRDFVAVNPPGLMVLLSPVGWLSSLTGTDGALAAARVLTVLVDVTNVALVGLVLRRRGRAAQVTGMTILALFPGEVGASHTLLLEPYVNLLCLLAMLALFGRDGAVSRVGMAPAGALLGLACTVKLFAVFPVIAIGAILLVARQGLARRFFIALAATSAVVSLPFMIGAPSAFFHQALLDQVQRSGARTPMWERLASLSGAVLIPKIGYRPGAATVVAALIGAGIVFIIVVGRRRRPPLLSVDTIAVAVFTVVLGSLFWAGDFYYHYASALAPWLAIVLATSLPAVCRARRVRTLLVTAAFVAFAASLTPAIQPVNVAPNLRAAMQVVIPPGSCVVADSAAYTIIADRFVLPAGCPDVVDSFGTTMQLRGGRTGELRAGQGSTTSAYWQNAFSRADYVVLSGDDGGSIPMSASLRTYLNDNFRIRAMLPERSGVIYQKVGHD